jgi:hypothetical protein
MDQADTAMHEFFPLWIGRKKFTARERRKARILSREAMAA